MLVEGESDREAIPILLRRLGKTHLHIRLVEQGDMFDVDEMSRHVRFLRATHRDLKAILVFRDSEWVDINVTESRAQAVARTLNRLHPKQPTHYIIVDHALEGWLLCDPNALRRVLGPRARLPVPGNPEDHPNPAVLMQRVFTSNRQRYKKTLHAPLIAAAADLNAIASRSPTFASLSALVRGL